MLFRRKQRTAHTLGEAPFIRSPILKSKFSMGRSKLTLFLLSAGFIALLGRAVWLQVGTKEFLQKQGEARYARTIELPATRGKIVDRNGVVLATSLPVKAVWAIPEDVLQAPPKKLAELARLLDLSESSLRRKLQADKTFVYLKRQVEPDVVEKVQKLQIPGIETKPEYKRYYPQGEVLAHVIGFTNVEDIGQEGIELIQQKQLAGINGSRRVVKDRLGKIVEDIGAVQPPRDGDNVQLSIDSRIQFIAYNHLKQALEKHEAKAGAAVVLDVQTGEILALVNLPTYNPNDRRRMSGPQLRNRVLTDIYEPGSTMKPFVGALALETKRVRPETVIQTGNGKMTVGSATINDVKPHSELTVSQIIQKSSNVGISKMALQMPAKEMWDMFMTLGFGQAPKVGFPGAVAGRVRSPSTWKPIEQATMSYGHGLSASLMQVTQAYQVFARDGDIVPATIYKTHDQPISRPVFSAKTARQMRLMLESVVSPDGTALTAQVPGYRVGGKTGTAHKLEGGRYVNKYIASFVGFAPVSNPRVVIGVMVDEPSGGHYGGTVAGPVFSGIAANVMRTLSIAPDAPVTQTVVPKQ